MEQQEGAGEERGQAKKGGDGAAGGAGKERGQAKKGGAVNVSRK
jgi:hypothetical protein